MRARRATASRQVAKLHAYVSNTLSQSELSHSCQRQSAPFASRQCSMHWHLCEMRTVILMEVQRHVMVAMRLL